MKNLLIICLLAIILTSFNSLQDQKGLARVQRIQGIEFYIMSEPLKDYDVVEDIGKGFGVGSGLSSCTMNNLVNSFANKASKMKKDTDFDAVVLDGKKGVLVKFKN